MEKLTRDDLLPLEDYSEQRPQWRTSMREVRRARTVHLGEHFTLLFENRQTIHYQIQEMLHIERIFDAGGIADELNAYNPLIPDGDNLKATLQIEYPDIDRRRVMLEKLRGVEHGGLWLEIGGERCIAIADEDLERSDDTKTSAVHFLRYPLTEAMLRAAQSGAEMSFGVEHPEYAHCTTVSPETRELLASDLG
ncbi:MAG: DUF3501 family protein [Gammaproteobacteria bacterium AqS3]|nr:DUF3501 family protein [Gammaproteobacteria bacterium AqS3]